MVDKIMAKRLDLLPPASKQDLSRPDRLAQRCQGRRQQEISSLRALRKTFNSRDEGEI
jgi:hypothetical protein